MGVSRVCRAAGCWAQDPEFGRMGPEVSVEMWKSRSPMPSGRVRKERHAIP